MAKPTPKNGTHAPADQIPPRERTRLLDDDPRHPLVNGPGPDPRDLRGEGED